MVNASPEPYSERVRLTGVIADAKAALDDVGYVGGDRRAYAARVGRLEALLDMLARSAERFAGELGK